MPDTALRALQADLEQRLHQPAFADIRGRRTRRDRRGRGLGALAALAVAATIGATAIVSTHATSTAAHGPRTYLGPVAVLDGRYAMLRGTCSDECGRISHLTLYWADSGATWQPSGTDLPGGNNVSAEAVGPLVVTGPNDLFYAIGGTIYGSTDAGRSWRAYRVDADPAAKPGPAVTSRLNASVNEALFTVKDQLYLVRPGAAPVHEPLPAGASGVESLSAFDYSALGYFVSLVTTVNGAPRVFRFSAGHWADDRIAPCIAGNVVALGVINVVAREDAQPPQAVVCTDGVRSAYRISTDGGATWSAPATLPDADAWTVWLSGTAPGRPYAGWIASDRGQVLRTTDGTNLVDATPPGVAGHTTIAYGVDSSGIVLVDQTSAKIYVSADAGVTWRTMP